MFFDIEVFFCRYDEGFFELLCFVFLELFVKIRGCFFLDVFEVVKFDIKIVFIFCVCKVILKKYVILGIVDVCYDLLF